ncbi:ATP-binding protein [Baekduia soli]|uniref:ATP-binding protein n=1 Tax=Baekduia soli TaxID=496014 RepID=A0A5B8U5T9_9ACTN|nr:ATP-binding protein [Baekduia soli]
MPTVVRGSPPVRRPLVSGNQCDYGPQSGRPQRSRRRTRQRPRRRARRHPAARSGLRRLRLRALRARGGHGRRRAPGPGRPGLDPVRRVRVGGRGPLAGPAARRPRAAAAGAGGAARRRRGLTARGTRAPSAARTARGRPRRAGKAPGVEPRRWHVPPHPAQLRRIRAAVTAYAAEAGMSATRLPELRLAVSEAATNAMVHAFAEDRPGTVSVTGDVDEHGDVVICVSDDGRGMSAGLRRPRLGRGLRLISALTDSVETRTRAGQGTLLRMRFATGRRPR